MAKCTINRQLIESKIYEMAFDADNDVIVIDGWMKFSSLEKLEEFEKKIEDAFDVEGRPSVVHIEKDTLMAVVDDTTFVESMAAFEERDTEYYGNVSVSTPEYHMSQAQLTMYYDFISRINSYAYKVYMKMKYLREAIADESLTPEERRNIEISRKQYYVIHSKLKEQAEKVNATLGDITKSLENSKAMIEYIVKNITNINEPHMVELANDLINDIVAFVDELGDKKYSSKKSPLRASDKVDKDLKDLRKDLKQLQLDFNRMYAQKGMEFLVHNTILLSDDYMKSILADPTSEKYKQMFGGAAIADIGFLQQLFLNVDTSSSFDGVLGQLVVAEFDMIAQENNNESIKLKRQFETIAKRLKTYGVDLQSYQDTDFLREKDEKGNYTGNFISVFSPEFRKMKSALYESMYDKKTGTIMKMIKDDFSYVDIFRLGFMHESREEILKRKDITSDFYLCCENIFKEKTGKSDAFAEWLAKKGHDADYEKEMLSKLGEKELDEKKESMMSVIIEYWYTHEGEVKTTDYMNPFSIMKRIDDIKNGSVASVSDNVSNRIYRFANIDLIPASEKGYNIDFRKHFIDKTGEEAKVFNDLYSFIYDTYTKFNLLYTGKNSLRATFLEQEAVDDIVDGMKGMARFDDVSANLRKMKDGLRKWIKDMYWDDRYISSDKSRVSLNYSDPTHKRFVTQRQILDLESDLKVDNIAKQLGINRNNYKDDDEYKNAIARKISLEGYNTNLYEVTMKSIDLYYAQRTRNDIYPTAKMIQRMYESYTNEKGNARENANKRFGDWIRRAIQKIDLDDSDKLNTKLSNISFIRDILSKFDDMPFISRLLDSKLMKRMSEDERELVALLKEAKKHIDDETDVEFILNGVKYKRVRNKSKVVYMKTIGDRYAVLEKDVDITDFKNKLAEYYDTKISLLGTDATLQNVVNLIRNLLLYKMLAGVSTSGLFNRIEGHLANAEMDATGQYWHEGNIFFVEQFFLGSGLMRYMTVDGEKAAVRYLKADKDKQWIKRMDIVTKISEYTHIYQDMRNQFDKTIEGVQKGVLRHNLNPFQLSVDIPEFKNQFSVVLAILMDVDVTDKNGVVHKMFDKKTKEFTALDIKDGELVLKPEFDTEENRCWIDFRGKTKKNNKKRTSASYEFAEKCKIAIKNIHGDYRENAALGFNNNILLQQFMSLKRWLPQKTLRGWSMAGSIDPKTGKFLSNYDIILHKNAQSGMWYDALTKGKSPLTMALPMLLSTMRLHKGILQTTVGAGASVWMIHQVLKNKLGARKGQIESNVTMLEESAEMLKAMCYELGTFIPRRMPRIFGDKFEFDASKHSFTDEKFKNEYGEVTLGNFRACARQMATYFYIAALGVMAKLIFWNPDDGDEDHRRKMYNWIDNNLENILSALTDQLFMLDNIEDKAEISNVPIIRLCGDIKKFCKAVNEMNEENIVKYGEKVFMPIRMPHLRHRFNPFESDFEYEKDTRDDRWIKNIRTDGEWGAEQDYKHIRAEMKKQYIDMWKDEKLPDYAKNVLAGQMQKRGYDNIYDVPEDVFKDMVSRSTLIPSKKQKEYKGRDYKFMHDVLMDEYENNPYLKNHALRFIFGGYDNRIGSYFQRMYDSDYERVRDNPYIDDGD